MVISVIVPVYGVEQELDRCVRSIQRQTYKDLEILLVDDGSPDNCPQMCDAYAKRDCRIKVLHKENGGISSARNAGLREAVGEFVLYVDSDDYIEPDACEKLLAAMGGDVDFVVGSFIEETGDKTIVHTHSNAREFVIRSIQKNEWYAAAWLNLYRRSFLLENRLFYREGIVFEDTHLMLKLYLAAREVACVKAPFYHYCVRAGSVMRSADTERKADTIVAIYNEWMVLLQSLPDEEYKRYLYGIMLRFYMRNCRVLHIRTWRIQGVNFGFAMKYALDFRERLKILAFVFAREIYLKL